MNKNNLTNDLLLAMDTLYHNQNIQFDVFYQGEIKVLIFIAKYKDTHKNDFLLPSDISKNLNMSSPRISSILNTLEKKEFIKRDFSTIDRRKVYISITNSGYKYVQEISNKTIEVLSSLIDKLGENDTKELIRILNRLV